MKNTNHTKSQKQNTKPHHYNEYPTPNKCMTPTNPLHVSTYTVYTIHIGTMGKVTTATDAGKK